jgi:hypothetical protein
MNRDEAKALLPIIQAFAEGKVIQYHHRIGDWIDSLPNFISITVGDKYRIKPEEFYVLYPDGEVMYNHKRMLSIKATWPDWKFRKFVEVVDE